MNKQTINEAIDYLIENNPTIDVEVMEYLRKSAIMRVEEKEISDMIYEYHRSTPQGEEGEKRLEDQINESRKSVTGNFLNNTDGEDFEVFDAYGLCEDDDEDFGIANPEDDFYAAD